MKVTCAWEALVLFVPAAREGRGVLADAPTRTLCLDNRWLHDLALWSSSSASPQARSCLLARPPAHTRERKTRISIDAK